MYVYKVYKHNIVMFINYKVIKFITLYNHVTNMLHAIYTVPGGLLINVFFGWKWHTCHDTFGKKFSENDILGFRVMFFTKKEKKVKNFL